MKEIPLFTVDAFTSRPFSGNPAAVCLISEGIVDNVCQKIAFEMNLSETAFVRLLNKTDTFEKSNKFGLRWFTPTNEVPLCGHATLASAAVLFSICNNSNEAVCFETLKGELICRKNEDGTISMDFPQWHVEKAEENVVFNSLAKEIHKGTLPVKDIWYSNDSKKLWIVLDEAVVNRKDLENLTVDADKLFALHPEGDLVKGVAVTFKGTPENGCVDENGKRFDFVSRYFAPWYGIAEDPVTGSLHCALGPYWSQVLNKNVLYARQCSQRGGDLLLKIRNDGRIELGGHAVVVVKGVINLP